MAKKKNKKAFVKFFSNSTVAENMQKLDNIEAAEIVFSHAPKVLVGITSQSLILLASVLKSLKIIEKAEASDWLDVIFGDNTPLREWLISLFDSIVLFFRKLTEPKKENKNKLDDIYAFRAKLKQKKRKKFEKLIAKYRKEGLGKIEAEAKAMKELK